MVCARVRRRGRKRRQVPDAGETPALPGDAVRLCGRARDMPRPSWSRSDGAARQGPAKFVEGDAAGDDEDVAVGGQLAQADRDRHPHRPLQVESERRVVGRSHPPPVDASQVLGFTDGVGPKLGAELVEELEGLQVEGQLTKSWAWARLPRVRTNQAMGRPSFSSHRKRRTSSPTATLSLKRAPRSSGMPLTERL